MSKRGLRGCVGFLALVLSASLLVVSAQQPMVEQAPTAEQLEFFEGRVRPVLAEKCFQCHSSRTSTPFGGLRLDSRQGLLNGGDSGPAVVPGQSADSAIVQRVQGRPVLMPPTGRRDGHGSQYKWPNRRPRMIPHGRGQPWMALFTQFLSSSLSRQHQRQTHVH